jgi:hypothetical protein
MADRPQLKATAHAVEDDDPFAELTRIMGFDPRVPASAAKPRPVPAPQPVLQAPKLEPAHLSEDFSIDLERELMGEFGLAGDGPTPVARAIEPDPTVVPTGWFSRREETVAAPAAWRRPAEPEPQYQPYEAEAAREQDVRGTFAGDDYAPDYSPDDERHYAREDERHSVDEEDRRYDHEEAAAVYAEEDAPADEADEGEYFEAEEAPRHDAERAAYAETAAVPAPAYGGYAEPQRPAYETYGEPQRPAYEAYAEPQRPAYDAEEEADVEAAVAASLEEEFAIEPDWTSGTDPVEDLMPAEEPAPAPQPAAAPVAQDLAADFDAAMAEVDMDFRAVPVPRKMERATPRPLPQFQPQPVAKVAPAPPAEPATDLEDELNALLGKMRSAAHTTQVAAAPVYQRREPVDVVGAMAASQARVEPAYEDRLSSPDVDNPFEEIFADPEDVREPRRPAAAAHSDVAEPTAEQIESDPINSLAKMAARLRAANRGPAWPAQVPAQPANHALVVPAARVDSRYDEDDTSRAVPSIETVDVDEAPVALADDLDLPAVVYEEERAAPAAYDDLDAELSDLLGDVGKTTRPAEPARAPAASYAQPHAPIASRNGRVDNGSAHGYAAAAGSAASDVLGRGIEARGSAKPLPGDHAGQAFHPDELAGAHPAAAEQDFDLDLAYDPALEDEIALPAYAAEPQAQPRRRGLLVAGIVGGVALVGAIGAFALSFGTGSSSDVPVLVRADETPIKVKPENPGGVTVPNQDSKVYDSVAGGEATVDASQEKLVTTTEEPVSIAPDTADMAADAELPLNPDSEMDGAADADGEQTGLDAAPAPKSEDRVEQATADDKTAPDEVAAVAPRKVRTLVVKPDGSLVPSGEAEVAAPAADATADETGAVQDEAQEADAAPMEDPVVSVESPEAQTTTGAVAPVAEAPAPEASAPAEATASTPASAPVAPARPAAQPAAAAGDAKPDKVAAIDPAPLPAGTWSVQIASQPTAESAQATWKDLARRYASVIGDRQPSIVKAEVAGKGTFWRVRIPAGSRNEAVSLCESYKSAGGNCFVSR